MCYKWDFRAGKSTTESKGMKNEKNVKEISELSQK